MRIPILGALGVAILGIILGSFFDYQLSSAIASPTSVFGLTISVIGPTIGFCGLAFIGGGFAALSTKQTKLWIRICFIALAFAAGFVTVYYAGREYFGVNGFYKKAPDIVGMLIVAVLAIGAEVGGFYTFRNCENKNAWIPFLCVYIVLLLVLVAAIPVLKDVMHRPRYRLISQTDVVTFHQWYQPCPEYKEYLEVLGAEHSDDFKSFPSGHTGEASILIVIAAFLPLADEKFKKYQLPMFIGACAFVILIAFARICAAAHFLSDVSMGATLTLLFTCIANEILIFINSRGKKEIQTGEEKENIS